MEIQTQSLPALVKMSSTYKIVVPANVEAKIRYLLRKYPHTEWSGILFTSHEGTFEDNNLVITCQDLYPMDLGDATFTQFKMSEDVAGYLADNMNLFGCDMGLIHSHHTMSTFFSGTDTATLRSEGNDTNCFVSLIVNNAGVYSAAVTRKHTITTESTVKHVRSSYEFFGEGEISQSGNPVETTETEETTTIEYFMLDVEREEVTNPLAYLDARFEEIEKRKKNTSIISSNVDSAKGKSNLKYYVNNNKSAWMPETKKDTIVEGNLWKNYYIDDTEDVPVEDVDYYPDSELIDKVVAIMLTGSFLIDIKTFNKDVWISKYMKNSFDKAFNIDENPEAFQSWADFIIEYIMTNFDDPKASDYYKYGEGMDLYYSLIADAIVNILTPYEQSNKYISVYCDILCKY